MAWKTINYLETAHQKILQFIKASKHNICRKHVLTFEVLSEVLVYHQAISIEQYIEEMGFHIWIEVVVNILVVNDRRKMLMERYYHEKLHWYWKEFWKRWLNI